VVVAKRDATTATPPPGDAASATTQTTTQAQPTLWKLTSEQRTLVYELDCKERTVRQELELGARLRMTAGNTGGKGPIRFSCEIAALSCAIVGGGDGFDLRFDSEAQETTNSVELAALGAAVERPFVCVIDPDSGAVTMTGFPAISAAIRRHASRSPSGVSPSLEAVLKRVFTDEFMGRSMHALTCVRGAEGTVPWGEGDDQAFTVDAESGVILDSLANLPLPPEVRYRIVGTSRYRGGRIDQATLTQDPLGVDGSVGFHLTWSMGLKSGR
jgi:hypothetical protein